MKRILLTALAFGAAISASAGSLPPAVDGTITIDGVAEATDSTDAAALAAATSIVLNEGSTLFYKASDPLALSATVSGTGAFVAVGAGAVTISGDNEGLLAPGHFAFTNTVVAVAHEHGLGSAGTGKAYFSHDGTMPLLAITFDDGDSSFTNSVPIYVRRTSGSLHFGSMSLNKTFSQSADCTIAFPSGQTLFITNNFEMVSGKFYVPSGGSWIKSVGTRGELWFREDCTVEIVSAPIFYHGGIHIAAASCKAGGIATDGMNNITMERDYTLTEDTWFRPYAQANNTEVTNGRFYYNLNGHSQNIAYLGYQTSPKYAVIGSADPCVLKTVSTATGELYAPFFFQGPISFWQDCAKTQTLKGQNFSTGYLKVTRGTLVLSDSANWIGNDVTVGGTGTLSLQSVNSLTTGNHVLTVEDSGSLVVGEGVTLRVRSATFGSVTLDAGQTYTMPEVAALLTAAGETSLSVSGDGSIMVLSEWSGWPEVGTATSVRIPKGTVAEITNADIAKVEALESIETGTNSEIRITATSPLALSANISGYAKITASGGAAVTLSGDNSAIVSPGHFEFDNTPVVVASEYALGSNLTATCEINTTSATNGAIRFSVPAGTKTLTNHVAIAMSGFKTGEAKYYFGSEAADEYVVQAASFSTVRSEASSPNHLYLRYNVEFIDGSFSMNGLPCIESESGKTAGVRRIGGETVVTLADAYTQAIIYISNLHLAPASLTALYGLAPSAANNIVFERDNCLSASTPLAPYANGIGESAFFNLNGHSQVVGRLWQLQPRADQYSVIKSDTPATLTAAGSSAAVDEPMRFRMIGPISYVHNTPASTTFTVVKLVSTGDLTVSAGSVTFTIGSGWAGTNVTVKSGGTLNLLSTASLTDDSLHNLTVEAGGTLQVADGVTIAVNNATFGGVSLEPLTTYTMDEVRALAANENVTLTGNGTIQTLAKSISGEWTGWPDVGSSSVAAIPNDTIVEILDGDIEKVEALEAIEMGVGASVVVKTSGARTLDVSARFVGSGRVWILGNSDTVTNVVLSGDNSRLISPGGFSFSNTWAVVSSRYGLGGARTARAEFYPAAPLTSNRSRLTFTGDATTNDVAIKTFGGFRCGYDDVSVTFRQYGDMDLYSTNSDIGRATFFNDFAVVGGTFSSKFTRVDNSKSVLRLVDDCVVSLLEGVYGSQGVLELGPASMSVQWQLAMEQSMLSVRFVKEEAFNNSKSGHLFFYDSSSTLFRFDLNGYSQTFAAIRGHVYGNNYQAANPDSYSFTVTSATPATLTLNGTASWSESVKVIDQASLTYAGTATQTIGYAASTTTGKLTVESGAVALERNAKWKGGDIVLNGGALIVRESAMTNTFGIGRTDASSIYVNGGKLRLEGTSAIPVVQKIFVGGECLDRGVYSSANCDWIEGDGSIRVLRSNLGAMMIIW